MRAMSFNYCGRADRIAQSLQLGILLEVSGYPKPGNVHRTADFEETKFEHFLASALALGPYFREAAERGTRVARREIDLSEVQIGSIAKNAMLHVMESQSGGNTSLGSLLLLLPLGCAASMAAEDDGPSTLRDNVRLLLEATTPDDAVDVYEAIVIAKPRGLGNVPMLDVFDPRSKQTILTEGITLLDIMKKSAVYDSISYELALSLIHISEPTRPY